MRTGFRRPWVFLALVSVFSMFCYGAIFWTKYQARQARLCKASSVRALQAALAKEKVPPIYAEAIRPLCGQPLFFLDKGKQCLVFETADGKYVLKLFKNFSKEKAKKKAIEGMLGAALAQTVLPDQTGVLVCSLGSPQTIELPTVLTLDEKGKIKKIDLHATPFILQKKALPFKQTLLKLICKKKLKEAADYIDSLFSTLSTCRDRGIIDRDGSLIRNGNLGCLEGRVLVLDTGKLCRLLDRKRITLHDINRLKPLSSWLEQACPDLLPAFRRNQEMYTTSCK